MSISYTIGRKLVTFCRSFWLLVIALCSAGCVPSSPITYLDWGLDQRQFSKSHEASPQNYSSSNNQIHSLKCNQEHKFDWPYKGTLVRQFAGGAKNSSSPGIDILGAEIGPVVAAWDGAVTYAGDLKGYGKVILIEHCEGLIGVYANMSALTVQRGNRVQRGQNLGSLLIDETYGGAVLHFELRENKSPIDPMRHLKEANIIAASPQSDLK